MGDDDTVSWPLRTFTFLLTSHRAALIYRFTFSLTDVEASSVPRAPPSASGRFGTGAPARSSDGQQRGVLLLWPEGLCVGAHQRRGPVLPPELFHVPSVRRHAQTGRLHL